MSKIIKAFMAAMLLAGTLAFTSCSKSNNDEFSSSGSGITPKESTIETTSTVAPTQPETFFVYNPGLFDHNAGQLIKMGTYDNKSIEWLVIAKEEDRALLITKDVLCYKPYHDVKTNIVTWDMCSLRTWLNNDFYNTAFTSEEKSKILQTTVTASKNPEFGENGALGGKDTVDYVFLLGQEEIYTYFCGTKELICHDGDKITQWWIRTPGYYHYDCLFVNGIGTISAKGGADTTLNGAVRPSMWIALNNGNFY